MNVSVLKHNSGENLQMKISKCFHNNINYTSLYYLFIDDQRWLQINQVLKGSSILRGHWLVTNFQVKELPKIQEITRSYITRYVTNTRTIAIAWSYIENKSRKLLQQMMVSWSSWYKRRASGVHRTWWN